jgi:hypothetical protein
MTTMLEEFTTEEQRSVMRFLSAKGTRCKEYSQRSVCHVKVFHLGGKQFADEEVEMEVQKWLRQQSKDICAAGIDTLVK